MEKKFISSLSLILILVITSMAMAMDVGVAWVGKSGMANRVHKGFSEAMKSYAPDIKLENHKELGSLNDLAKLTSMWKNKKSGMVILRSNGAKWLAVNPPSIPTFIGGCNHPGQLGAVKNLKAPEGNITGVTYYLPVNHQFDIFSAIIPKMKSVLLLLEKGHPSALIDRKGTMAVCKKKGIKYNEKFCKTAKDAAAAVKKFRNKVSAIIIGNQAIVFDAAKTILKVAGKTPVLSFSSKPVQVGALCGFVADDEKLGRMLAESLINVLKKGRKIKNTPIKVDPKPKFYLNAKTAKRIGVEVPYSILEAATIIE